MKIKLGKLKSILKEVLEETPRMAVGTPVKFEVVVSQNRNELVNPENWPAEDEDPNCSQEEFDNKQEALQFAERKAETLTDYDWSPRSGKAVYKTRVYTVNSRGQRMLVDEFL